MSKTKAKSERTRERNPNRNEKTISLCPRCKTQNTHAIPANVKDADVRCAQCDRVYAIHR